jgi:hypothetical protein
LPPQAGRPQPLSVVSPRPRLLISSHPREDEPLGSGFESQAGYYIGERTAPMNVGSAQLDTGGRSPRKLLGAVVAQLLGRRAP